MNWKKIYDDLIESRRNLKRTKENGECYELHHILPRSWCGGNEETNLILLTPQEHFIAHLLLPEFATEGKQKDDMMYALCLMVHGKKGNLNISARQYDELKRFLHKPKSAETRAKMRLGQRKWIAENPKRVRSAEAKAKTSNSHKGKIKSKNHITKIFEVRKGNGHEWHNEDTKNKIKETLLKKYESGEIGLTSGTFQKGSKPWNADPERKFSEKSKEKMRLSHLGKKLTPEQIKKREETRKKNGWYKKDRKIKNDD